MIFYERKPKNGKATRQQLVINGASVVGSSTELAATLWQDSVGEAFCTYLHDLIFCSPQISFFLSLRLVCEEVVALLFLSCMLLTNSFFIVRLISPVSTTLTDSWYSVKLLYKEPLATNGSKVPYPTTIGRLVTILSSLPSAQRNSRENPASSFGYFSTKRRTQDNSPKPPILESKSGRRLPFRYYDPVLALMRDRICLIFKLSWPR